MSTTLQREHHRPSKVGKSISKTADTWQARGTWNEFVGKARRLWGHMTDDEMSVAEGNYQELLGRIQRKTGESLADIRKKLFHD